MNGSMPSTSEVSPAQRCRRASILVDEVQSLCQGDNSSHGYDRRTALLAADTNVRRVGIDVVVKGDIESGHIGEYTTGATVERNTSDRDDKRNTEKSSVAGKLRIVVTDTGAGICAENQLRLFKEIVQFNPEVLQAGGGSGLGLWITSSIVKMHGGSISVFSAGVGRGSSFTVEIDMQRLTSAARPSTVCQSLLARYDSSDQGSSVSEEKSTSASSPTMLDRHAVNSFRFSSPASPIAVPYPATLSVRHPTLNDRNALISSPALISSHTVLVADDSSLNRKLLCKLLSSAGYTCDEASDGQVAVEMVKRRMSHWAGPRKEYHVILMDFVMPNMDGPTATKSIRDLGYRGPIFGVTGNAVSSDVDYFVGCGANAVLPKPFDYSLFKELIEFNHCSNIPPSVSSRHGREDTRTPRTRIGTASSARSERFPTRS